MPFKPLLLLIVVCCLTVSVRSQDSTDIQVTNSHRIRPLAPVLSIPRISDTAFKKQFAIPNPKQIIRNTNRQFGVMTGRWNIPSKDSLPVNLNNPFHKLFITRPAIRVNGGYVSYQFNYRSIIDTPYAEKDVMQHNVTGRLNVTVANLVPLQVNYWIRRTNSQFFRNIADVQLAFNGAEFRNQMQSTLRSRLLALAPAIKDSLLQKQYALKKLQLAGLEKTLKTTFNPQKLIEANEIIKVPKFTWKAGLPDSVNLQQEDSIKKAASLLLEQYAQTKQRYDQLNRQVDSLKGLYENNLKKIYQYRQMIAGKWDNIQSARAWKNKLEEYGMQSVHIPAAYQWLLGVRNFSLGRTPVNYSELTAKNISINGVNFEYNSWYYFAVTAGAVNYRFRDFAINGSAKQPQYLYMVRAGIGRLERNYFILSAFRGQKQLFNNTTTGGSTIRITGFSAETRWAVNRTTWLTAEAAQSMAPASPGGSVNPASPTSKFSLSDKNNQAIALHLYSSIPATGGRVEAFYKKAGANYQSFSSYTTNTALESWYIKADQPLFKRKLRLAASLRTNEYSNPFIIQNYKSNAVFKSITASWRMRKWPVITVGYQPMSQLTKVNDQVIESRFQTLNATVYHSYTIKQLRMASTVMLNKFYNNNSDTSFLYYNATNSYLLQSFFFNSFAAHVGVSYTKNNNYRLQVLDGCVQPNIPKLGTIGVGVKINNLNNAEIKAGAYVTANIRVYKQDMILISYEHGYLPGSHSGLVRNEMGTVQFIKTFGR